MSSPVEITATLMDMGPPEDDGSEDTDPKTGNMLVDVRLRVTVEDARKLAPFLYDAILLQVLGSAP